MPQSKPALPAPSPSSCLALPESGDKGEKGEKSKKEIQNHDTNVDSISHSSISKKTHNTTKRVYINDKSNNRNNQRNNNRNNKTKRYDKYINLL